MHLKHMTSISISASDLADVLLGHESEVDVYVDLDTIIERRFYLFDVGSYDVKKDIPPDSGYVGAFDTQYLKVDHSHIPYLVNGKVELYGTTFKFKPAALVRKYQNNTLPHNIHMAVEKLYRLWESAANHVSAIECAENIMAETDRLFPMVEQD